MHTHVNIFYLQRQQLQLRNNCLGCHSPLPLTRDGSRDNIGQELLTQSCVPGVGAPSRATQMCANLCLLTQVTYLV